MSLSLLLTFCFSYFLIALSPGLCMTLAMSLGISIGPRRTLWMVWGELTGIALLGTAAALGVSALLMQAPLVFKVFKILGAAYLFMLGWQSWRAPAGSLRGTGDSGAPASRRSLLLRGFVTAVSNPKAWAFFMALLPPFIDHDRALAPQLAVLLSLMVVIEFGCLMIYALGGRALAEWLFRKGEARWLNRASAALLFVVGFWLLLG
jgi:threonine/homoserine/homoserine lactone efflux protein